MATVLSRNFWRGSSRGGLYTTFHLTPNPVEFKKVAPLAPFLPFFPKARFSYDRMSSIRASLEQRDATATGLTGGTRFRFHGS